MTAPRRSLPFAIVLSMVAILLPCKLLRAREECSLWVDETASLVLAGQSVPAITALSAADNNPPGYFVLLKSWLKLGRLGGAEPGILWARTLGIVAWVGLAVLTWVGGKRLVGAPLAALLAVAVAASSNAAVMANDVRGYSVASVALFACFLALLTAYEEGVATGPSGAAAARGQWLPWSVYAACAGAALWTHVLSLVVFGCLALLWLLLTLHARAWRSPFAAFGASAHLAALLAYVPWLLYIPGQLDQARTSAPQWMTPASAFHLATVFYYWFPLGRAGSAEHPPTLLLPILGSLSLVTPLAFTAHRAFVARDVRPQRTSVLLAVGGLGGSSLFVGLLWGTQRLGLASVFHAPRYPALAVALWAAGLVGLASVAADRWRRREVATWLLMAPWLSCCLLGQIWSWRGEIQGGLRVELGKLAESPPPGATVYAMPSELIAFHRRDLAAYTVKRIEDLPCGLRTAGDGWVLNLNRRWRLFDRVRDLIAQQLLAGPDLAATTDRLVFPASSPDYELYHLRQVRAGAANRLCAAGGLRPAGRTSLSGVASAAVPEEQRFTDGWSYPEVNGELRVFRWASSPRAVVRFDRPLPAGDYVVTFEGYRAAQPASTAHVTLTMGETSQEVALPPGEISLRFAVHLAKRAAKPWMVVVHPTWRSPAGSPREERTLAFALILATVEPTPSAPPGQTAL